MYRATVTRGHWSQRAFYHNCGCCNRTGDVAVGVGGEGGNGDEGDDLMVDVGVLVQCQD